MDVKTCIAQHDALLADFASARSHEVGDPFWNELISFPVALSRLPPAELDAATTSYCEHLGAYVPASQRACASYTQGCMQDMYAASCHALHASVLRWACLLHAEPGLS